MEVECEGAILSDSFVFMDEPLHQPAGHVSALMPVKVPSCWGVNLWVVHFATFGTVVASTASLTDEIALEAAQDSASKHCGPSICRLQYLDLGVCSLQVIEAPLSKNFRLCFDVAAELGFYPACEVLRLP